jgi:peroxin-1
MQSIIGPLVDERANQHADSFRSRHISEMFLSEFGSAAHPHPTNSRGIILIATAESPAALNPVFGVAHVFEETINLKPPNKEARRDVRYLLICVDILTHYF